MASSDPRRVRVVLYPGIQALDTVGPIEVFEGANQWRAKRNQPPAYDVQLIAASLDPVPTESVVSISPTHPFDDVDPNEPCHTLLVPGGNGVYDARSNAELVGWVRLAATVATRVATVCSGTFLLAEAGVLDGCRVTTHWARAEELRAEYPNVQVDPDPIFVHDGRVWTSAGVTAGIDLALALVDDDLGGKVAHTIARYLVMFTRRPGGQSQFAPAVWADTADHEPVRAVQEHVVDSPGDDLSIPRLAARAGMSERNFARVFTREVGESPGRYVERVRVEAARRTLETTDDGVAAVAKTTGFGTAETMRRAFLRHVGVAPTPYRERFTTHPAPSPARPQSDAAMHGRKRP